MSRIRTAVLAASLTTVTMLTTLTMLTAVSLTASVATAAAPVPAAPTYIVKRGDNLAGIAAKLGVTLPDLLTANKLTSKSSIHPGEPLAVPQKPGVSMTSYVVKPGDYLGGIAAKHGVPLAALLKANGLTATSAIRPGSSLNIPAATITPPSTSTAPVINSLTAPGGVVLSAPGGVVLSAHDQSIATLLSYLRAQVGKPYVFNTAGPDSFDCSGLVVAAYSQIGINLPHQSLLQSTKGTAVDWTTQPIQAGDLILMFSSDNPGVISHVGVAMDA
ncbi:MAG TPA: LysM peptidoglycan-binding domain-containing protein, partial [Ilumatobacteraceae bacterium]